MRAPIRGHARVELVALVSFHSTSRLVFVRIYPRQFCHKQQRPNSTLQLFNFYKPRSVLRVLAGSVSPRPSPQVYLQQNKKKAEAKGKKCHAKTMWSLEKPI